MVKTKTKTKHLTFATSPKTLHAFYPKWVPSPVEPAHNLQNQEII